MKKKICIITGDPNSINSEIISKSLKKLDSKTRSEIILIGNFSLLQKQLKKFKTKFKILAINEINKNIKKDYIKVFNIPLKFNNCFNVSETNASKYVTECLNFAHNLCEKKKINGFINCPIDKKLIIKKNVFGVTEFLGKKNSSKKFSEVMLLYNKKLSVVPITTHIKLNEVSRKINKHLILKKIKTLIFFYKKIFRINPKVAILGLNPHNSELLKNSEEVKKIIPAITILKKKYNVSGPMVADNFFKTDYRKYNVVVGMYHDQVLIPFKHMFKYNAINITLGLNYLRVSPDHGTAKDLILKNKANPESLLECIKFMKKIK